MNQATINHHTNVILVQLAVKLVIIQVIVHLVFLVTLYPQVLILLTNNIALVQ